LRLVSLFVRKRERERERAHLNPLDLIQLHHPSNLSLPPPLLLLLLLIPHTPKPPRQAPFLTLAREDDDIVGRFGEFDKEVTGEPVREGRGDGEDCFGDVLRDVSVEGVEGRVDTKVAVV